MFTNSHNLAAILLVGLVTGALGSMLGIGGGVFLIPILVLAFHVPMHYAIATSILSVIATSSAAASSNVERGTANMRLGMVLELATVLGAICGGLTAGVISTRMLEALFALVLVPTAIMMWRGKGEQGDMKEVPEAATMSLNRSELGWLGGKFVEERTGTVVSYHVKHLWAGLGVSFLAGNISGLLGIGGGTFKVPALHLLCRVPMKAAAATSNFMIGVTAAGSAFLYYGRGEVLPALTAAIVLGVLLGTRVGILISGRIEGAVLRRIFAILLLAVALQMSYRVATGGT